MKDIKNGDAVWVSRNGMIWNIGIVVAVFENSINAMVGQHQDHSGEIYTTTESFEYYKHINELD